MGIDMQGYWEHLQKLVSSGSPFVAVTLVDVIASAPATLGSKMLVTPEGLYYGTVGGGKVEMKALAEARAMLAGEVRDDAGGQAASRFVEWNLQRDVGMTCGGGVRLFFEAYNTATWPIVIFGAGHCAQALVRLLVTLRCQITVIDPREEWLAKFAAVESGGAGKLKVVNAVRPMAEYVKEIPSGAFVLLMTMGHATDQPILIELLKTRPTDFRYVGVIGSAAKAAVLQRGLRAAEIPEERLGLYCCPIGLPIGTNDPAEIAVSVAAQLLERRDAAKTAG